MLNQKRSLGLTLIEVLIALAIVSIALTAIIKSTTQDIRSTTYLQTKTIAMWVGQKVMNEVQVGVIQLPGAPDQHKDQTEMLGRTWHWLAGYENTANSHIKKIVVNVYESEEEEVDPIVTFESYIYHADE